MSTQEQSAPGAAPPVQRKIIHVDMDCFFAAIEVRDHPEWRGLPLAVAYEGPRSVVTTASYEARPFGVRSAMPLWKARELCPQLLVAEPRFEAYVEASRQIRGIFREYTPLVEPMSLDEAYLDVSRQERTAWQLVREIRARIRETTGLSASAGVAPNKMLAKIASDWRKPDGQFAILPGDIDAFMRELPVGRLCGVGPRMQERLAALGVATCGQLQALSRLELAQRFGAWGEGLHDLCRGVDERPVEPVHIRRSLSNERTYDRDLHSREACAKALEPLIEELDNELRRKASERPIAGAVVKVKCGTSGRPPPVSLLKSRTVAPSAPAGRRPGARPGMVRLLGVGVRFADVDPAPADPQLTLWETGCAV
jgi:DNA polymerase-4